jgi:hypothetical protein
MASVDDRVLARAAREVIEEIERRISGLLPEASRDEAGEIAELAWRLPAEAFRTTTIGAVVMK